MTGFLVNDLSKNEFVAIPRVLLQILHPAAFTIRKGKSDFLPLCHLLLTHAVQPIWSVEKLRSD